jgi:hypothetical protein
MATPLAILKNFSPVLQVIEHAIQSNLDTPALILTYSCIDVAGWIDSQEPYASRSTFMGWVDRYLLPCKPLPCTAADLYSARCGLLHTLVAESAMTEKGKARMVFYAWRPAPIAPLELLAKVRPEPIVAIYGNDLVEGLNLGLLKLENELVKDASADPPRLVRQTQAKMKAGRLFTNVPYPGVSQ